MSAEAEAARSARRLHRLARGSNPCDAPDEPISWQAVARPEALAVSARGVSLTFQTADGEVQALSNVDLDIAEGDFVSFIGPSGCGKTTLLRVIADLEQPTAGTIPVNGVTPEQARLQRHYGYIFQAPRSIRGGPSSATSRCRWRSWASMQRERRKRVEHYLKLVNLSGFERKFPWQLSGGMQQRASIARALSFEPALLLMDEPFGALDEIVRDHLNEQLLRLWDQTKKTVRLRHPLDPRSGVPVDQDRGDVAAAGADHRYHRQRFSARPHARNPRDAGIPQDRAARALRTALGSFL